MSELKRIRQEFMKQAREFDTGRKEEDFHTYLRQNNLEHHLSESQIIERNRDSNYLNGLGLTFGVAVPLTLGAIFGANKLLKTINSMGMRPMGLTGTGENERVRPQRPREILAENLRERNAFMVPSSSLIPFRLSHNGALSGVNTRPMPVPEAHINEDVPTAMSYGPLNPPPIGLFPPMLEETPDNPFLQMEGGSLL